MEQETNIYIVDDDEAVRDALCGLFSSIGLATRDFPDGDSFLRAFQPGRAGCLLLDMRMPGMSAFEVLEVLRDMKAPLSTIVITGHGDIESGVRAMKTGAFDFIQKPFQEQMLLELVQKALRLSEQTVHDMSELTEIQSDFDSLTPREREVLANILNGEPNKRIAFNLGLSEKTVEFHRANIMKKMRARSLADLIQRTLRLNLAHPKPQ